MPQPNRTVALQSAASANGNGTQQDVSGFDMCQQVEIAETNGGTCTVTLEGSFDGTNWYSAGYQQVDATAAPARAVAAIGVTANMRHVYQVLDPYPLIRARMSAVASSPSMTIKLYVI